MSTPLLLSRLYLGLSHQHGGEDPGLRLLSAAQSRSWPPAQCLVIPLQTSGKEGEEGGFRRIHSLVLIKPLT